MTKFFKPEDFDGAGIPCTETAADISNSKLEREGKVVWAYDVEDKNHLWWTNPQDDGIKNYKALLINIEPIEQCKHPAEKVSSMVKTVYLSQGLELEPKDFSENSEPFYQCECGATVKPGSFVKVE